MTNLLDEPRYIHHFEIEWRIDKISTLNFHFLKRFEREEVSSILAMSTRPAPCGSPAATIASAMRGSSASPDSLTGHIAMEEFLNSAWRSQRTSEEPFGREEKTRRTLEFEMHLE